MGDREMPVLRCVCGDPIRPENWALGPGWVHEHGSSQCRVFARPADPIAGAARLAEFCKAIRLPIPACSYCRQTEGHSPTCPTRLVEQLEGWPS